MWKSDFGLIKVTADSKINATWLDFILFNWMKKIHKCWSIFDVMSLWLSVDRILFKSEILIILLYSNTLCSCLALPSFLSIDYWQNYPHSLVKELNQSCSHQKMSKISHHKSSFCENVTTAIWEVLSRTDGQGFMCKEGFSIVLFQPLPHDGMSQTHSDPSFPVWPVLWRPVLWRPVLWRGTHVE